jgi:uncharacterized membrane protein (Fun14 family)
VSGVGRKRFWCIESGWRPLLAILLIALQFLGWITIDWGAVKSTVEPLLVDSHGVALGDRLWAVRMSSVPYGGGIVGGFAVGFKLG